MSAGHQRHKACSATKFPIERANHGVTFEAALERDNSAQVVEAIQDRFAEDAHILSLARRRFAYLQAARINASISQRQHEYDLEQMRSGLLRPSEEAWAKEIIAEGAKKQRWRGTFDDSTLARIDSIHDEIRQIFKVEFPHGDDGFLSFSPHKCAVPPGWGAAMAYCICARRLQRMDDECNWDEPTIDEPDGIWCEIIFQQAIRCSEVKGAKGFSFEQLTTLKKRYREFLNLPPVVETMNACNMSIGHSEHGKPIWMRFPRRLTDRDDSKNNLLVETITSNMAKLDYPKKSYGWNYKSTKQILISKKWARPGVMPAEDLTLAADISGIRSEDALNMSACVEIGVSSEGEEG